MIDLPKKTDPDLLDRLKEKRDAASPLQRAIWKVEQRQSWVIGEMMLSDPALSREDAEKRYADACPDWLILEEMRRLRKLDDTLRHCMKFICIGQECGYVLRFSDDDDLRVMRTLREMGYT